MLKDLIVIGAGNPDIVMLIEEINDYKKIFNFLGFLEKNNELYGTKIYGYEVLGGDELLKKEFKDCLLVVNLVSNIKYRNEYIINLLKHFNITHFPNLIHPSVKIKYSTFGAGNIIYQNVTLGANVKVGDFNIIFYGSIIGHEAIVGNNNLLGANVMIGARTKINNNIYISNSSTISVGLNVCDDVFIGVGSVVVNSILKPKKIFGNPAKELRF